LARQSAERHGGTIEIIASQPNEPSEHTTGAGAVFLVRLPLPIPEPSPAPTQAVP
jgi:hypothetical protein